MTTAIECHLPEGRYPAKRRSLLTPCTWRLTYKASEYPFVSRIVTSAHAELTDAIAEARISHSHPPFRAEFWDEVAGDFVKCSRYAIARAIGVIGEAGQNYWEAIASRAGVLDDE